MNIYTELARQSLEYFLTQGTYMEIPDNLPEELLNEKRGTFVSWHDKNDDLRGCIGTFLPTKKSIADEIISNSVASGTEDPRFHSITLDDLKKLHCNVDILSELEHIQNIECDLNPKKYGVYIKTPDGRSGLLLPDLDGVDTVYQQISIACQKGGIDPQDDSLSLYRFTVDRFEE